MIEMEEKKLFLIVYLSNSQRCVNNLYVVANTKIDANSLFVRNIGIEAAPILNIIDFGVITDSDLKVLTELKKINSTPILFDYN